MCSLVDDQFQLAVKSFEEENTEIAKLVIEKDGKVDKYDLKIEKICQKIFALTQPVAMDLRLLMSSMTLTTDLERIGDISVNIAENVLLINKKPDFYNRTKLAEMILLTKEMLKNALDSYINGNAELAKKVIISDDQVDKLNAENHSILKEIMKESPDNIEPAVALLVISRELERVADHSTNIAEDVFFIVEAQLIKHKYEKYIFGENETDDDND
jgi:phosphate transport system protein